MSNNLIIIVRIIIADWYKMHIIYDNNNNQDTALIVKVYFNYLEHFLLAM